MWRDEPLHTWVCVKHTKLFPLPLKPRSPSEPVDFIPASLHIPGFHSLPSSSSDPNPLNFLISLWCISFLFCRILSVDKASRLDYMQARAQVALRLCEAAKAAWIGVTGSPELLSWIFALPSLLCSSTKTQEQPYAAVLPSTRGLFH